MADPLHQEGRYLEFNRNDRKTNRPLRLSHDPARYKVVLARPEKPKEKFVELGADPGWYVDERSHIPDPGKRQSIRNQSLPQKGKSSGTPGLKTASDCV